jgi:hypothetical protein
MPQYQQYRDAAFEYIQRVIKFTSEITHSHLHAFWHASSRLSFSTIAHFVFHHHITSTTASEYKETHEMLRKWLWALRVLSQGWEEGTGLAAFRVDSVFSLGKTLFAPPKEAKDVKAVDGGDSDDQNLSDNEKKPATTRIAIDLAEDAEIPAVTENPESGEPQTGITTATTAPSSPQDNFGTVASGENEEFSAEGFAASWFQPVVDLAQNPPQLDLDTTDLLLNEDIMPQEKQIAYLGHDPQVNSHVQYGQFFSDDRFVASEDFLLTEDLHELLTADIEGFDQPMGPMWRPPN